jgi:hypothetical protein
MYSKGSEPPLSSTTFSCSSANKNFAKVYKELKRKMYLSAI